MALAFPDWNLDSDVDLIQETDGITNKCEYICDKICFLNSNLLFTVVKCIHKPSQTKVLVRTYGKGSDILIDRNQEFMVGTTIYITHTLKLFLNRI